MLSPRNGLIFWNSKDKPKLVREGHHLPLTGWYYMAELIQSADSNSYVVNGPFNSALEAAIMYEFYYPDNILKIGQF